MANAMLKAFDKYKASIEGTEIVDNPSETTAPKQPAPEPKKRNLKLLRNLVLLIR